MLVGVVVLVTLVGAVVGYLRRPSTLSVAATLDAHAGNHDAIASALQLSVKPAPTPLETRAIADADTAAQTASPAAAFPWRLRRPALLTAIAAVMLTGAVFIPARWTARVVQLAGMNPGPAKVEVQKALADAAAAEQLIKAVEQPAPTLTPQSADNAASRSDPLAELKEQLQNGNVSPKEATQQAATAIERAADKLDQRAANEQAAHDLLRDRLAQGQQSRDAAAAGVPESELTKALREGNLDKAAAEAERLSGEKGADALPAAERARLAEDLKKLADDLKRTPTPPDNNKPPAPLKPNDDPKPDDANKPTTPPSADQPASDLADKLDRAAEELKSLPKPPDQKAGSPQPPASKPSKPESQPQQIQQASPDKPQDGKGEPSTPDAKKDEPKPGDKPDGADTKPEKKQGDKPNPDGKNDPSGQKGEQPTPGSQPQAKPDPNAAPSPREGTQTPDASKPSTGDKPQPGPADKPQGNPQPQSKPDPSKPAPDGQTPDGQPPEGGTLDQLKEQLKKLADQPRNAKQDKQDAQKLREQAQKMWDNATPQQRKEMEKLAREMAKGRGDRGKDAQKEQQRTDSGKQPGTGGTKPDGPDDQSPGNDAVAGAAPDNPLANSGRDPGHGTPGEKPQPHNPSNAPSSTQDIDARSKGETEAPSRVIAEWLTNKPAPREGVPTPQAPADVARAVRQTQQNAEQAVQERTVPSRLSPLIRRYFERLPQAVGTQPASAAPPPATPSASPPSTPAKP